jgi:CheY-like chemotaxis protein
MEILKGFEYTIIRMPENISMESIDGLIEEFRHYGFTGSDNGKFLLDMQNINQLHRAALVFIIKLNEFIKSNKCSFSIAGIKDAVENALIFNHVNETVELYKTLIDFEKQNDIVFDVENISAPEIEPDAMSASVQKISNVIIIEPNLAIRQNQKSVLVKLPVNNLVEVKDANEALKKVRDIPFRIDLIICDLESNKLGISQIIKNFLSMQSCREAKIICTTVKTTNEASVNEALAAGAFNIIDKYFNMDNLKGILSI